MQQVIEMVRTRLIIALDQICSRINLLRDPSACIELIAAQTVLTEVLILVIVPRVAEIQFGSVIASSYPPFSMILH